MIIKLKNSTSKRKAMIENGISYQCHNERCKLPPVWRGKNITLQIDHIDGNKFNNHISNLRFLCPNCHTQTKTWGGRNKGRYKKDTAPKPGPSKDLLWFLGLEKDIIKTTNKAKKKNGRVHNPTTTYQPMEVKGNRSYAW